MLVVFHLLQMPVGGTLALVRGQYLAGIVLFNNPLGKLTLGIAVSFAVYDGLDKNICHTNQFMLV